MNNFCTKCLNTLTTNLIHNPGPIQMSTSLLSNHTPFTILSQPVRSINRLRVAVYPWMNRRKPYWVKQESNPNLDSDLIDEHKEFLKQQRQLAYEHQSPLIVERCEQVPWTPNVTQRCGLIAIKLGMYPLWTKTGKRLDCTILQIPDNHALRYTPPSEIDKFLSLREPRHDWLHNKRLPSWVAQRRWGIQLVGAVSADPIKFTPEWCGLFKEAGVPPKIKVTRFLVSPDAALKPGTPLTIHHFRIGDHIDVTARTINRGFQGVIERWGMSGGPAAHGSTKFHRRMGSAAGAGRAIIRGKHMPGVMGNRYRSLRGLQIVRMNPKLGLIYVPGPIPGPVHSYCLLHDSWLINRRHELDANPPPVPTWFPSEDRSLNSLASDDDFDEDIYHDMLHRSDLPSITYTDES